MQYHRQPSRVNSEAERRPLFYTSYVRSSSNGTDDERELSDGMSSGLYSPSVEDAKARIIVPQNSPCLASPRDPTSDCSSCRSCKLKKLSRQLHSAFSEQRRLEKLSLLNYHKQRLETRDRVEEWRQQVSRETSVEVQSLPPPRLLGKLLMGSTGSVIDSGEVPRNEAKNPEEDTVAIEHQNKRPRRIRVAPWEISFTHTVVCEAPQPKFLQNLFP